VHSTDFIFCFLVVDDAVVVAVMGLRD
jgi:hypothetical protein